MWNSNFIRHSRVVGFTLLVAGFTARVWSGEPTNALKVGRFNPAFDHLGNLGGQLDAAIAGGCTLDYATGIGAYSYAGLPPKAEMDAYIAKLREYNAKAHSNGVLMLSYLCCTSIVDAGHFATNWGDYFPHRPEGFAPRRMLQQDIHGTNLVSWYGGAYAPADMWNPYWREYTKLTIKLAVEAGHDGVFFDNPTVHMSGNYSEYAMKAWARFLAEQHVKPPTNDIAGLRAFTVSHPDLWRKFRTTEAADFLREMRDYGRSLKRDFILTANNSLNTWDSFYSQPRDFAYSIPEQSKQEDVVTIEDMSSAPRRGGNGFVSYAGTLRLLHAISNSRPLSICTTDGDYVAPADLMDLAIAECAAHDAAYMVWSCWDPAFRNGFATNVARYHGFMRTNEAFFAASKPVSEMLLVFPYENWLRRRDCPTAALARELSAANLQYDVLCETDLTARSLKPYRAVVCPADEEFVRKTTSDLLGAYERKGGRVLPVTLAAVPQGTNSNRPAMSFSKLKESLSPTMVTVENPSVRAVVRRTKSGEAILHLYNLGVSRKDTYHDEVSPLENAKVVWYLPEGQRDIAELKLLSPDVEATVGDIKYTTWKVGDRLKVEFVVPKLGIWTVVEAKTRGK